MPSNNVESSVSNGVVTFRRRRSLAKTTDGPSHGVRQRRARRNTLALTKEGGIDFDIVSYLQLAGNDVIEVIKKDFTKKGNEVNEEDFTAILLERLELEHRAGNGPQGLMVDEIEWELKKLFGHIDAKSLKSISWDDFTTYCVDSAILNKISRELSDNLIRWELDPEVHSCSSHRPLKLKPIQNAIDSDFFIIDASSSLYVMNSGFEAKRIPVPCHGTIIDVDYVPFEDIFCVATAASELVVCDSQVVNVESVKVSSSIQSLAWNKSAKVLVSGDRQGLVGCWMIERTPTDKIRIPVCLRSWQVGDAPIFSVQCHRSLGTIICGFLDGVVSVLHPVTGRRERTFQVGENGLNCLAVSEHQNIVIVGGREPVPYIWTLTACEESKPFSLRDRSQPHEGPIVTTLGFPDTAQAMSLDFSGVLKVWDLRTFSCLQSFTCRVRDPKISWLSLSLSSTGTSIVACDRKNIMRLNQVDEEEQHAAKGVLVGIGCSTKSNKVVSVHLNSLRLWDDSKGSLVGEIDLNKKEEATAVTLDSTGGRLFVGGSKGHVYVYNASTAGLIARFPKAHKTPVLRIAFLEHANLAVSCSEDGEGAILKPPALGVQSDTLFTRTQPGFRCMPARICLYLGPPTYAVVAGDDDLRLHFFDCRNITSTALLINQTSIPFGPKIERLSKHHKQEMEVVSSMDKFTRFFSAAVAFPYYKAIAVADSNTIGLFVVSALEDEGITKLCRWALDCDHDGPAITDMCVVGGERSLQMAVSDDGGRITLFDLSTVIEDWKASIPPGSDGRGISVSEPPLGTRRKTLEFGPVTAIAYQPRQSRIAAGFTEGTVAMFSGSSLSRVWDSTLKTNAQALAFLAQERMKQEEGTNEPGEFMPDLLEGGLGRGHHREKAKKQHGNDGGGKKLQALRGIVSFKGKEGGGGFDFSTHHDHPGGRSGGGGDSLLGTSSVVFVDEEEFDRTMNGEELQSFLGNTRGNKPPPTTKTKRNHNQSQDPNWLKFQLDTLCGEADSKPKYTAQVVQRPHMTTKKLKIPVFLDLDHTAECIDAEEDQGDLDLREQQRREEEAKLTHDTRKTRKEESMLSAHEIPSYAKVRKFIGERTEAFPALSLSKQRPTRASTPSSLLRPLAKTVTPSIPDRSSTSLSTPALGGQPDPRDLRSFSSQSSLPKAIQESGGYSQPQAMMALSMSNAPQSFMSKSVINGANNNSSFGNNLPGGSYMQPNQQSATKKTLKISQKQLRENGLL